jgi:predicted DNA-binding mobile mystery protein A
MTTEKKRRLTAEREAYEKLLTSLKELNIKPPKRGWIKAVREMLGMTVSQLGKRSGLDSTTVTRLEDNEVKDSITLRSLKKLADSLECDLIYSLVPKTSFEEILSKRAEALIKKQARKAEHTMSLEDQGGGDISSNKLALEKAILIRSLDKQLWEEK